MWKIFLFNLKEGRLKFTINLTEGVKNAYFIFLTLPSPQGADSSADLNYVLAVASNLGKILKVNKLIVDKSKVQVGTGGKGLKAERESYNGEFDLVSNLEFLRRGVPVDDFMKLERVFIGNSLERARKLLCELYTPFVPQGNPIFFIYENSTELTKIFSEFILSY